MSAYLPHGQCYLWQSSLVALHAVSDGLIAIAYLSIPVTLIYFIQRRRDLPYPSIFWLFSAFIVACGLTHALAIWTLWQPSHWLSGVLKAVTALISIFTAGSLLPTLPRLLALPNLAESQHLNRALQQEIAERQRTEASLRRYERIISATHDGICLIDRQSRYQIANDTYLKWHQKSADQVLGQPVSAVLGASVFEQKIRPHLDRCLTGEPSQSELWVEYPGLGRQFISMGCAPYEEGDGTISGMIVSLRNRTPLKQAEAALQQSEMTQRAILEGIPDLLIHLNQEGIRLNFISGGEIHLLPGVACELQQSIYDTLPRDLADLRMHYVRQAIATDQRQTYEHTIHTPAGVRYEETRVVKLNDQEALLMVRDITDRKQTEDQLRRYERIVSASSDGIALINRDYIYEIVNDTYLHDNQRQREEIIGHSVAELSGAAVFERVVQPQLAACLAGETVQYEDWFEYPALGRQFARVTYSPYRDPDGAVAGVVAVTSNLTGLKQTEQALQESELRFRSIFNQMYQFIGLLAPDGTLLEANRTALDFAGVSPAAVIGQPFWDAPWWQINAATQAQLREAIARAAQGEFMRYEVEVQGGEGQVITIDFSLRPVFDEAGQVVLLIPEGRDISDRIQAEKQLELQAIITRNMAEGICLVQADNGHIVYANPKFERMFGYDPGELVGQHVSLVNYQDQSEAVAQELMAAVLTQGEHTYEIHNVRKDGAPFWCEATTSVFEHPNYGKVLVAVQQDISDRKTAQEKIQASLKEKELLLKEIYHRVKNNLQVIHSLLNLQSRYLKDPALKTVLKDSQSRVRAMALVHEKLYQSKDLTRIDLADYVKSLVRSLLETYCLNANQITTRVDIETCSLDIETALPCGLILTELISNSLKYAFPDERKGHIVITSSPAADQHICLAIKDDGVGLPAHIGWHTVSSLGLSLVRNLAQQIKAEIDIAPTSSGTEFQLLLPLQEPS